MMLRNMIRERGYRLGWVAQQLDMSGPMLSFVLHGRRPFPADKIKPLARLLRVTPAEIEAALPLLKDAA